VVKNKVKRMDKTQIIIGGIYAEKYAWGCKTCGRIYPLRREAESCLHEDIFGRFGKRSIGLDESIKA